MRPGFLWIGIVFFWCPVLFAARTIQLKAEGANLYEKPNLTAKILEKLPGHEVMTASSLPTQGFYKVRTKNGALGWIESTLLDLPPSSDPSTEFPSKSSEEDLTENGAKSLNKSRVSFQNQNVQLKALINWNLFNVNSVITNLDNISLGYSLGGEFELRIGEDLSLVLRFEEIFKNLALTDSNTGKNFYVNLNSLPIMPGIEWEIAHSSSLSARIGAFAGIAFQTRILSTNYTDTTDKVADIGSTCFTALAKLEGRWRFSQLFSAFLEGGYRFLQTSQLTSPSNNGSLILYPSFTLNFSGPVIGGGLSIGF